MLSFLSQNHDCFTWSHEDMTGINPEVTVHHLQVDLDYQPVKQKRRKFTFERNKIINEEIQELIDIGSIQEVQYTEWLAKVVIQKNNGKWRVCINFTDLNKACPQRLILITTHRYASRCNSRAQNAQLYGRILQIQPYIDASGRLENTSFITERGIFC